MEEFYSLQGEGFHTGEAAYFIRVGGCDVGCYFCDVKESWNASIHSPTHIDEIVRRALQKPARSVIVTGGEPMLYDFSYFCEQLHQLNFKTSLETSGSQSLSGSWDWICLSPKQNAPPLETYFSIANELKVIICDETDIKWAEENAKKVSPSCLIYLQPEWSNRRKMMPVIIDYILKNPKWKISLQSHKYMNIP